MISSDKKRLKEIERSWIRQRDFSDCGVACLASLIRFYGGDQQLEKAREQSGTSKKGTTLLGLYQAANQLGLKAEAFEADIPSLKEATDPCILHIIKHKHLQHYVVCYGYENGYFIISDPAEGVAHVTEKELDEVWQSKALLLVEKGRDFVSQDQKKNDKWEWIKRLAEEDTAILTVAIAIGLFISVLGLSTAVFTQKLIDEFLPEQDLLRLMVGLGLLAFLLFARNGLTRIRQLFLIRQSRDFNNRMIKTFYGALLRLPFPFFQNRKTGDLIARMNDTRRLQKTVTYLIGDVIIDALMLVVATLFIMAYSFWLGLFMLGCVPVFFLITWRFHKPVLDGQKNVMQAHALNESNYVDTIQGIEAIKEGNKEPFYSIQTEKVYGFFQNMIFDLGKVGIRFSFWSENAGLFFIVGTLGVGSYMVVNDMLMLGAFIAIIQMSGLMLPAASRLALTNLQLQEARVAFDRMYEFASLEPEYPYTDSISGNNVENDSRQTEDLKLDSLEVRNLSFRFPGRKQLLKKIDFTVARGSMVAILGESGCGKTTFLNIIKRFYEPESGSIRINGETDWKNCSTLDWRDQIATVSQDVKIFNASLIENICLGEFQEQAENVIRFCKESGLEKFFMNFPQGYATILGEEGTSISGGQKQLVALARALYQQPQLLLLDEPTAALDRETEKQVLEILLRKKEAMGTILVTHRVQSAKVADQIYIMEDGIFTESGTPDKLLQTENLFSKSIKEFTSVLYT